MRKGYLLDTNHLSQAVRPSSAVFQRMRKSRSAGARFGTCIPVLCEIENGILQVSDPVTYRASLAHLLASLSIWPLDFDTVRVYGQIHQDLKRRGRVLSQVDMMIASLAIQLDVVILTTDRDFEALPQVTTENWT